MRLLVFTFHLDLAKTAPMLVAWPWESRRQVTVEGLGRVLERRLFPRDRDAELAPRLHAEDVIRVLEESGIDDASLERAISSLERQDRPELEPERILRPRCPGWLSTEHYHAGAIVSFQILDVEA